VISKVLLFKIKLESAFLAVASVQYWSSICTKFMNVWQWCAWSYTQWQVSIAHMQCRWRTLSSVSNDFCTSAGIFWN